MVSNKKTILAIDDEVKALNLLKLTLEMSGFETEIASEGKTGIELAKSKNFDLIILDIKMPDIDGWSVCNTLKHCDETRDIPVVFLSALSGDTIKKKAMNTGAIEYLTKPINPDVLIDVIEKVLGK
jgi:DNA-binding response OmpR family regulator